MAPLLKILVQWLPSFPTIAKTPGCGQSSDIQPGFDRTFQQQRPIDTVRNGHGSFHPTTTTSSRLSAVSWGKDHLNVFGLQGNNVTHKFWDGYQWNPSGQGLELLGNGLAKPPVAVTWGPDHLAIFGLDDHSTIKHQHFEAGNWQPDVSELGNLGGGCDGQSNVAASTWGQGRLDVFCRGPDGDLLHQFWDGTSWRPSLGSLESLGGSISSSPSVISWGENRLDIFAINADHALVHRTSSNSQFSLNQELTGLFATVYWDGYQYSLWETFEPSPEFQADSLTVASWEPNHLDVFALDKSNGLWHLFWDGATWSGWGRLSDPSVPLSGRVGVTSWASNRLDIVALSKDTGHYLYKFYNGESWQPSWDTWYDKGSPSSFASNPAVVSWGENRLDIFGESDDGALLHQAWTGNDWHPSATEWEYLAGQKVVAA
ncbi:MAG: hypothetical protein Q9216_004402 [Gyalolechia sp. 2 TL-2023]